MDKKILDAKHINKTFHENLHVHVLKDISISVCKGEFVSIMGKSGCGKSTLLYILSTMDTEYDGSLWIDEELMTGQSSSRLCEVRNEKIGFVFQFHYLLNEFTTLRNIMLPALKLNKLSEKEIKDRAVNWLSVLGIADCADKLPTLLSGGEKQRVAIARALINDPIIIMGDEPTGNLDKNNSHIIVDIFEQLSAQHGQSSLIVTHDPDFAEHSHRIIQMEDGRITSG